jgi:putative acetyltransferase
MMITIRPFAAGDEPALRDVFESSISRLACNDYTQQQIEAWLSSAADPATWSHRMRTAAPYVALMNESVVGFADVQRDGLICFFYVAGSIPRRGVGTALMRRVHQSALEFGALQLRSNVSITAQPFFRSCGFAIVEQRLPVINGVALSNAAMIKQL